uniref:Uncharacterized protein n=1 Tax=Acrobeloides nanus TaxID=290746 RepID=A0A914DC43_9BILA
MPIPCCGKALKVHLHLRIFGLWIKGTHLNILLTKFIQFLEIDIRLTKSRGSRGFSGLWFKQHGYHY